MLHSSEIGPSCPLNQLCCISRKIGEVSPRSSACTAGGGGAGGIAASAAPQPFGFGLAGRCGAGTVPPSGVTKPEGGARLCRSGAAGVMVGSAIVGELVAPGVKAEPKPEPATGADSAGWVTRVGSGGRSGLG